MNVCLLVVKQYDTENNPCYTSRFGRFAPDHVAHMEAELDHPDSQVADIVVFPDSFAAAMRNFNAFCVDPEHSR